MKLRPVRNKITILSRQSDVPTVDIALLEDYLREKHPEVHLKVMCRNLEESSPLSYGIHMLEQMWNMANSSVVVLDGYCIAASILNHRAGLQIIQMWHALAAIKRFGYQNLGTKGGRSHKIADVMCMHRNYDHILAPSRATGEIFCRAFGTDVSRIVYLGLPRIDVLRDPAAGSSESSLRIREEYDLPRDREIILYAPTFRKAGHISIEELVSAFNGRGYLLVICPHPLDRSIRGDEIEDLPEGRVVIDRKHSAFEWIPLCDRIITDYSAISVEGAVAGKPVYFYIYDIEEYEEDEGLNLDPRKEVPHLTAKKADQLVDMISREYPEDELKRFRDRYVETGPENCTEKLGEYLVDLI